MKHLRLRTAMVAVLWVGLMWSAGRVAGQCCGDCNGNGRVAINELITAVNRSLKGCQDDGVCDVSVATCTAQLGECQDDLADCRAQPGLPASGQTTSYGPGSDGDKRAGAALSYTDNGDGTITDNNTGLMWEKKDDSEGIHDFSNTYGWWMTSPPYEMNGMIVTVFLATLNTEPCFAGRCDWRIPNVKELQSIVDYQSLSPSVSLAFNTGCVAGCTVRTCSCTQAGTHWSSTTLQINPENAWNVNFLAGDVTIADKSNSLYVRAVRGGL